MKAVSVSKEIRIPGLVLSDKVPVSFLPYFADGQTSTHTVRLTFFGSVYHATFPSEGGAPVGVFVQFNEQGIQDLFCQCEVSQESGNCVHIAETIRAIFATSSEPLHKKFFRSPYYRFLKALPLSKKEIQLSSSKSELRLSVGSQYIVLEGTLDPCLAMLESEEDTEETSIKFAHLNEDDLNAWYSGKASPTLAFELSTACDIARFLFLKEQFEKKPSWQCVGNDRIQFIFDDLKVSIPYHTESNLELFSSCIGYPSLHQVEPFSRCSSHFCSFKDGALLLHVDGMLLKEKKPVWNGQKGSFFQEWPKKYVRKVEDREEFEHLLDIWYPEALEYIVEWRITLSESGIELRSFANGMEGDQFFGRWLLTKEGTFLKTSGALFQRACFVISKNEVADWLDTNRAFLSLFSGFNVQETSFLRDVGYIVSPQRMLSFVRFSKVKKQRFLTFGKFAFVPEKGFFLKEQEKASSIFDEPVLPHRVSEFIRHHKIELQRVEGFFATKVPILSVDLSIREENGSIVYVESKIVWDTPAYEQDLLVFDEFGYLPTIGFFELPSALSLAREVHRANTEDWNSFFEKELPLLTQRADCHLSCRLKAPEKLSLMCNQLSPESVDESIVTSTQLWNVDFFWLSPEGRATFEEVREAKRRGERWVVTDAGLLCLAEARFEWLLWLAPSKKKRSTSRRSHVKTWDFLKIRAHDDLHFVEPLENGPQTIVNKLLHDVPVEPLPPLSLLNCSLRSYQRTGVEWLWMLYSYGFSGLLCDDMGVGKTHQAMGLFASVRTKLLEKGCKKPFLVICPTSLIWHWKEKLASFLPSFKLFSYLGHDRTLEAFDPNVHDLFLTTYGIWRNECLVLGKIPFEVAIFDELQMAKNHCSRIWAALSKVSSNMRLGLTGTPIENQLRELKALFDLLLPGYLPDDTLFREWYSGGSDKEAIACSKAGLVSKYVRPFVLRRRKSDVLRDLPAKVEEKYHVELTEAQRTLYHEVATSQAGMLIQQLRDESSPIPYIHIFALLSSLKQICNHPACYLKEIDQYEQYSSAKWEAFQDLLEEAIESGQKVVVFSQFLAMLDIMKLYLEKKKIVYAEIRGRTKDRGDEMKRFHQDPSCKVFLGSLQAAGLGIDLTAATVVIHYDRWWNAARENQATDRVHRMGQARGVQVCKLITLGTIEERIDAMIERKAQLLEGVISYDDHQVVKKLSRAELLELVQDLL